MSIDTSEFESAGSMADLLSVATSHQGEHVVVRVEGEIDLATGPTLRAAVLSLLDEGRHRLVVDLDRVTFIDSTGLGILLEGHRLITERGGSLSVVCHTAMCRRLFEISGLDKVLAFHDSVDAALSA
jgi:anti-sigma B factor antagonist